jgi:hypothetical protein
MTAENTTAQPNGHEVQPEESVAAFQQDEDNGTKSEEQPAKEQAEGGADYVMEERVIESEPIDPLNRSMPKQNLIARHSSQSSPSRSVFRLQLTIRLFHL